MARNIQKMNEDLEYHITNGTDFLDSEEVIELLNEVEKLTPQETSQVVEVVNLWNDHYRVEASILFGKDFKEARTMIMNFVKKHFSFLNKEGA